MTQKEKKQVRYNLAITNPIIKSELDKKTNFYMLQWSTIAILDEYAEIFCIIETNGISRARKLWTQLQETYKEMPF